MTGSGDNLILRAEPSVYVFWAVVDVFAVIAAVLAGGSTLNKLEIALIFGIPLVIVNWAILKPNITWSDGKLSFRDSLQHRFFTKSVQFDKQDISRVIVGKQDFINQQLNQPSDNMLPGAAVATATTIVSPNVGAGTAAALVAYKIRPMIIVVSDNKTFGAPLGAFSKKGCQELVNRLQTSQVNVRVEKELL